MPYDFDTAVSRDGIHSAKWNVTDGELPMWVADMDFPVAPPIVEALANRLAVPSFGYTHLPESWAQAVSGWWDSRHGWRIPLDTLAFCTGVMPAVSSAIRTLTEPGGNVLLQAPVYNNFFNVIEHTGRVVVSSDLVYADGRYSIDWDDLGAKMADPATSLFLLCNPHNPTGQIWTADELARLGDLASANGVIVVSDEIHCDVTDPAVQYIPFALAAPGCPSVVCLSATKTFSIPGLQTSAVAVADEQLRAKIFAGLDRDEVGEPNAFAVDATIAAFTKGGPWVDEMRVYVQANKDYATAALQAMGLHVVPGQATYLLWVDCASLVGEDGDATPFCRFLRATTGLYISDGAAFHGRRFLRWNLGCPRALVDDGLERLRRGIEAWRR